MTRHSIKVASYVYVGLYCFVTGTYQDSHHDPQLRGGRRMLNPIIPLDFIAYKGSGLNGVNVTFPLGRCQGDCNSDWDCRPLKCFSRKRREEVPGCLGEGASGIDYCFDPADGPSTPPPTPPPTPKTQSGNLPPLFKAGDNGSPDAAFPLDHCQGDCDADSDCDTKYICWHRNSDNSVPGCSGFGEFGKDYCIDPGDAPPPTYKRLRLYWHYDFYWQETHQEMKFCMERRSDGDVKIDDCGSGSTEFEFVFPTTGEGGQIRERTTDYCMELVGGDRIKMRYCDIDNVKQRWVAGEGSFYGSKFDIRPVVDLELCLSQHHHPKPYEEVYAETCHLAHLHNTAFWTWY